MFLQKVKLFSLFQSKLKDKFNLILVELTFRSKLINLPEWETDLNVKSIQYNVLWRSFLIGFLHRKFTEWISSISTHSCWEAGKKEVNCSIACTKLLLCINQSEAIDLFAHLASQSNYGRILDLFLVLIINIFYFGKRKERREENKINKE